MDEHKKKMANVLHQIENSHGEQKKQLIKHYHRLQKQLLEYKRLKKENQNG